MNTSVRTKGHEIGFIIVSIHASCSYSKVSIKRALYIKLIVEIALIVRQVWCFFHNLSFFLNYFLN